MSRQDGLFSYMRARGGGGDERWGEGGYVSFL